MFTVGDPVIVQDHFFDGEKGIVRNIDGCHVTVEMTKTSAYYIFHFDELRYDGDADQASDYYRYGKETKG